MGNFSEGLSKRLTCKREREGFCLICDTYKTLSEDHVPPKSAITVTRTEQKLIGEAFKNNPIKIKGAISKNGNKFKTICRECNYALSKGDAEIGVVYNELTKKIYNFIRHPYRVNNVISVNIDATEYIRAMCGHILSATSEDECKKKQPETPYFTPIKDFVLGKSKSIDDTHDIYYWFYPSGRHLSAKILGFHNRGNSCAISLLSFYPIAFLITEKGKGIYPVQASKLDSECKYLSIDMSQKNINYSDFPFVNLEDGQFYLMADYACTISYPIKESRV